MKSWHFCRIWKSQTFSMTNWIVYSCMGALYLPIKFNFTRDSNRWTVTSMYHSIFCYVDCTVIINFVFNIGNIRKCCVILSIHMYILLVRSAVTEKLLKATESRVDFYAPPLPCKNKDWFQRFGRGTSRWHKEWCQVSWGGVPLAGTRTDLVHFLLSEKFLVLFYGVF